ncbi:MAG: NYN domain-containing protein [Thermodesulfobacteriota bacterium]
MALHLIIDGYNFIRQSPHLSSIELRDFQKGREALLGSLARYKSVKGHRITVIFDGWKGGDCKETHDRVNGVRVIYSRLGETADEVIKRMVREEGERAVVITADSDIASFTLRENATVISPHEFEQKIAEALSCAAKGLESEDDYNNVTKRRGAARRPSRAQRRCQGRLKKL